MQSPAELVATFRRRGLKITPQRVAIFEALQGDASHPTAVGIYTRVAATMPSISLRTVYQTLNDLAALGEIQCHSVGTAAMRFDSNVDDHHHLVCDVCGGITDTYLDVSSLRPADLGGFTVTSTRVILQGTCDRCAAAAAGQE
jgi:Fe2+ or Zn2+ uptake regulation protein